MATITVGCTGGCIVDVVFGRCRDSTVHRTSRCIKNSLKFQDLRNLPQFIAKSNSFKCLAVTIIISISLPRVFTLVYMLSKEMLAHDKLIAMCLFAKGRSVPSNKSFNLYATDYFFI
jgi:hypothetical protein